MFLKKEVWEDFMKKNERNQGDCIRSFLMSSAIKGTCIGNRRKDKLFLANTIKELKNVRKVAEDPMLK